MGVNFINKCQNLVVSKSGKSHIKIVQFSLMVKFFEYLHSNTIVKEKPYLSCNLHIIGANMYINLAVDPFMCKKVWSWMGGWVGGWMDGWVVEPG